MDEIKLLREIKDDPDKFGEIFEAFYPKIFGYAFRRTNNYDAAKDIAAETFLKAYSNIGQFKWRNISILYWLYRITTNEINRYFNGRKYKPESLNRIKDEYGIDLTDYSNAETERIQLEDEVKKNKDYLMINSYLQTLNKKYQDVITLRYFEHKSIKEISIILNKKEGTVKSLLSRGIEKLKSIYIQDKNEKE